LEQSLTFWRAASSKTKPYNSSLPHVFGLSFFHLFSQLSGTDYWGLSSDDDDDVLLYGVFFFSFLFFLTCAC